MTNNDTEKDEKKGNDIPKQHQPRQPGRQTEMRPQPDSNMAEYRGSGKLESKVAIITGGDSGIGRSVAVAFAKEGADLQSYISKSMGMLNAPKRKSRNAEENAF